MAANYCSVSDRPSYLFLGAAIIFLIAASSLGYFTEINSVSSLGYEIKSYQKKIDELSEDNQRMKIFIAEKSSFKELSGGGIAEKLNLVGVSNQRYLVISSSSLASR